MQAVEAEEEAEAEVPEAESTEEQDEPGRMTQLLRAYRDAVVAGGNHCSYNGYGWLLAGVSLGVKTL